MFLALDAAADRDDARRLREIDRLLRLAERRLGLLADGRPGFDELERRDVGAAASPRTRRIGAEGAELHGDEVRRRPERHHVGDQLGLEHRPLERPPASLGVTPTQSVTSGAIETGSDARHEVARLVGVRGDDQRAAALALDDGRRSRACRRRPCTRPVPACSTETDLAPAPGQRGDRPATAWPATTILIGWPQRLRRSDGLPATRGLSVAVPLCSAMTRIIAPSSRTRASSRRARTSSRRGLRRASR